MPKNLGRYDNDLSVPRKKDIDSLESRVKTNEDNIAMAESDIEGLQGDIGTLQTDVGAVKTALESKQDTVVGGASTIVENNLTANRALISNASGKVAVSDVTSTELGYLDGVTSNVQTQLTNKAPINQGDEFIEGTQTAATNKWTGKTTSSQLYNGKVIDYYLPYTGTSTAATLNLTLADGSTTGEKGVYFRTNIAVTSHFPVGSLIHLVYRASANRWEAGTQY